MKSTALLIPCYKPTDALIEIVRQVREVFIGPLVVIDDGNTKEEQKIFLKLETDYNVEVVRHATNLGKGRALKSGFNYILNRWPQNQWVITADADGQHKLSDILKVANAINTDHTIDIILGVRQFRNKVPFRSRLGNDITRWVFRFFVGLNLRDTQTGLRGFNSRILRHLLTVSGEYYEFETGVLLEARNHFWKLSQVDIETIYIDENKGSHFNPLFDSMKIYFLIFRFLGSSLSSSFLDFLFYAFFVQQKMSILESTLLARFFSGWFNFFLNKKIVFRNSESSSKALIRYWSLVAVMGTLSSLIVNGLNAFLDKPLLLKVFAESVLFIASFSIQKEFVFNEHKQKNYDD